MTVSHGRASHGSAKRLTTQGKAVPDPLIGNQQVCEASRPFRPSDDDAADAADAAMWLAHGLAWGQAAAGFPRSGGRPPIQSPALSHRSPFLQSGRAGGGRGKEVGERATTMGAGSGSGGRRCPHRDVRFCPLYLAAHMGAGFGCDDGRLEEQACGVARDVSYAANLERLRIAVPGLVEQLQWQEDLVERAAQRAINLRRNGIH